MTGWDWLLAAGCATVIAWFLFNLIRYVLLVRGDMNDHVGCCDSVSEFLRALGVDGQMSDVEAWHYAARLVDLAELVAEWQREKHSSETEDKIPRRLWKIEEKLRSFNPSALVPHQ